MAVCRRWLSVAVCVNAIRPGLGFIAWQLPSLAGPSLLALPRRLCRCAVPSAAGRCSGQVRAASPPAAPSGAATPGLCQGLLPNVISGQEPKAGNPPALPPLSPASPLPQRVRAGDALPPICTVPTSQSPPNLYPWLLLAQQKKPLSPEPVHGGTRGCGSPRASPTAGVSHLFPLCIWVSAPQQIQCKHHLLAPRPACSDLLSHSFCVGRGWRSSLRHGKSLTLPA